jgi:hypothetical protein
LISLLPDDSLSIANEMRGEVASVLGSAASLKSIVLLRKIFRESDPSVQTKALEGLQRAFAARRVEAANIPGLFDDIQKLVFQRGTEYDAALVLLDIDRATATKFLLSSNVFTSSNEGLLRVMIALVKKEVGVPTRANPSVDGNVRSSQLVSVAQSWGSSYIYSASSTRRRSRPLGD